MELPRDSSKTKIAKLIVSGSKVKADDGHPTC